MSLDGQMERLCALYGEKSDDELLAMYDDRDDLTAVAQEALAQTMHARRLVGGAQAAVADPVADEQRGGTELSTDEVVLWTFRDTFEAGEAIRILDEARVWQRLESYASTNEGMRPRMEVAMTVIVRKADFGAAVELLRAKMGLFPKPEVGDGLASPLGEMQEMVLLAMFDRSEGLTAAEDLGRAGISYCWRDGADESEELPDDRTIAIEVRGAHLEQATAVVEKGLAERPE